VIDTHVQVIAAHQSPVLP